MTSDEREAQHEREAICQEAGIDQVTSRQIATCERLGRARLRDGVPPRAVKCICGRGHVW